MKNPLSRMMTRSFVLKSLLLLSIFAVSVFASAQTAGYDLLQTGSGASIDLSSVNLGNVALNGVPIQGGTGTTDTIMHRTQDVPQGGGSVPLEVTALFMKSVSPVTFNGQQVDVYVTINNSGGKVSTSVLPQPDSLSGSTGTMTIRTDGTFDSSFNVNADVIFVKAGTSVTNSANYVGHQAAKTISLSSTNSSYTTTPPAGYPNSATFPSGGIYPRPVHNGPHPVVPSKCGTGVQPISPQSPNTSASSKQQPTGSAVAIAQCISAQ
ncbi:MAG TPA: hypothetical protein VFP11_00010 [Candidatus Angelobacter sp.]|nr:hypothetical protein [Candidatus Angelobacter sp.]